MGEGNVFPIIKMPSVKKRVKIGGMTAFTNYYLTYTHTHTHTHIYIVTDFHHTKSDSKCLNENFFRTGFNKTQLYFGFCICKQRKILLTSRSKPEKNKVIVPQIYFEVSSVVQLK